MANLEFSAPYNESAECLEEVFKLKQLGSNRIREVFLSGPQEFAASGRVMDNLTLDAFLATVDRIHGEGLQVNLIMNPTCEGPDWYGGETLRKNGLVEFEQICTVSSRLIANRTSFKTRFDEVRVLAEKLRKAVEQ